MKKKKGNTLIEVLVSMAIFVIIFTSVTTMLFKIVKQYRKYIYRSRQEFYAKQALYLIEYEIQQNKRENISVENNQIIINNSIKDNDNKYIKYENAIVYYENNQNIAMKYLDLKGIDQTKKYFIKGVSGFLVYKHINNIYIKITILNGRTFERCVGIKM